MQDKDDDAIKPHFVEGTKQVDAGRLFSRLDGETSIKSASKTTILLPRLDPTPSQRDFVPRISGMLSSIVCSLQNR
jgi:hypothetical protein